MNNPYKLEAPAKDAAVSRSLALQACVGYE
jgi:hypothetical protein